MPDALQLELVLLERLVDQTRQDLPYHVRHIVRARYLDEVIIVGALNQIGPLCRGNLVVLVFSQMNHHMSFEKKGPQLVSEFVVSCLRSFEPGRHKGPHELLDGVQIGNIPLPTGEIDNAFDLVLSGHGQKISPLFVVRLRVQNQEIVRRELVYQRQRIVRVAQPLEERFRPLRGSGHFNQGCGLVIFHQRHCTDLSPVYHTPPWKTPADPPSG